MEDTSKTRIVKALMKTAEDQKQFEGISNKIKEITSIVLENEIQHLSEVSHISPETMEKYMKPGMMNEDAAVSNVAYADIAKFGEIYLPIAMKVIPSLVINNMVGIQPMNQPNGFVYAMRASYATGPRANTVAARGMRYSNSQILNLSTVSGATANVTYIANAAGAIGFISYIEGSIVVVKLSNATQFAAADAVDFNTAGTYAATDATVVAIYKNEIAQAAGILKYYSGLNGSAYSTDAGMYADDIGQISIHVERQTVEAKTRQLFAEYPIEAEQDLRNIHKRDIRSDLAEITTGEIVNEINKEFIDDIAAAALVGGTTYFDMETADGRWEIEKFRNLFTRITKAANDIAMATRLGPGNYIIGSPNVITALSQIDGFQAAPVQTGPFGNVSRIGGEWFVGTIAGQYSVYRDMFATTDYATVGRKGSNEWDAGLFFLPYIPLQFIAGQDSTSLQPKMKFMTRYAKVANPLNDTATSVADPRYYRYINVDNLFGTY